MQRLLFPEVPPRILIALSSALFVGQLLTGTDALFAFTLTLGGALTLISFNVLGGMATTSGICVASLAFRLIFLPIIAKILLWQPSDSILGSSPIDTALVVLAASSVLLLASYVPRYFKPRFEVLLH